jgi:hypothetical protein
MIDPWDMYFILKRWVIYAEQRVEVAQASIHKRDRGYSLSDRGSPNPLCCDWWRCSVVYGASISLWCPLHNWARLQILAVMHCSREPGYWKSRKWSSLPTAQPCVGMDGTEVVGLFLRLSAAAQLHRYIASARVVPSQDCW